MRGASITNELLLDWSIFASYILHDNDATGTLEMLVEGTASHVGGGVYLLNVTSLYRGAHVVEVGLVLIVLGLDSSRAFRRFWSTAYPCTARHS